jgi:hypothetical protein
MAVLLFLLALLSYGCESGVEAARQQSQSQRVLLYPQSPRVSSIVSTKYRTAYHFQPPRNWINGIIYIYVCVCALLRSLTTLSFASCSCFKKSQLEELPLLSNSIQGGEINKTSSVACRS